MNLYPITSVSDSNCKTIVKLLLYTGLRRGELCGLEWQDIDFDNALLTVSRSSLYLSKKGIFEDTTKNFTSQRVIKIPMVAIDMMKEYRLWQTQQRLLMGDRWQIAIAYSLPRMALQLIQTWLAIGSVNSLRQRIYRQFQYIHFGTPTLHCKLLVAYQSQLLRSGLVMPMKQLPARYMPMQLSQQTKQPPTPYKIY